MIIRQHNFRLLILLTDSTCLHITGMLGIMDNIGPMAATVTDVALLLEVIAGYDGGRDPRQKSDLAVPKYSQLVCCVQIQ